MRRIAPLTARILLGLIFALSAISKLSAPGIFQADVAAYHIVPNLLVAPFALALPWLEAMLALYLLLGLFVRPAAIVAGLLLLIFTIALAINVATGNTAHGCGCLQTSGLLASVPLLSWLFGGLTIGLFDVVRDLVLAGVAAVIFWGDTSALSLDVLLFGERKESEESLAVTPARHPGADRRSISGGWEG